MQMSGYVGVALVVASFFSLVVAVPCSGDDAACPGGPEEDSLMQMNQHTAQEPTDAKENSDAPKQDAAANMAQYDETMPSVVAMADFQTAAKLKEVADKAAEMQKTIQDKQQASRVKLMDQKHQYEEKLDAQHKESQALVETNRHLKSEIDVQLKKNTAVRNAVQHLRNHTVVMQGLVGTLKAPVTVIVQLIDESLRLTEDRTSEELKAAEAESAPTSPNELLKSLKQIKSPVVSLLERQDSSGSGAGSEVSSPFGMDFTKSLQELSNVQGESESELKNYFNRMFNAGTKLHIDLQAEHEKLNVRKVKLEADLAKLHNVKDRIADGRVKIRDQLLQIQKDMRSLHGNVSSALAHDKAGDKTALLQGTVRVVDSTQGDVLPLPGIDSVLSGAAGQVSGFAAKAATLHKRLEEQHEASRLRLQTLREGYVSKLKSDEDDIKALEVKLQAAKDTQKSTELVNIGVRSSLATVQSRNSLLRNAVRDMKVQIVKFGTYLDTQVSMAEPLTDEDSEVVSLLELKEEPTTLKESSGTEADEESFHGLERGVLEDWERVEKEGEEQLEQHFRASSEDLKKRRLEVQAELRKMVETKTTEDGAEVRVDLALKHVEEAHGRLVGCLQHIDRFLLDVDGAIQRSLESIGMAHPNADSVEFVSTDEEAKDSSWFSKLYSLVR